MIAVKAKFDGKQVILPADFQPPAEQDVIVVFEEGGPTDEQERALWMRASEESLQKAWDNADDAIYDKL